MKGSRSFVTALFAVAGLTAVTSLVMSQLDQQLSHWFFRVEMPEVRLRLTRWVAAPLLAGLIGGAFSTALFRTKRLVLPLAPAGILAFFLSVSWLYSAYHWNITGLFASSQWRALFLCLPIGALLGVVVVRRCYPGGGK